MNITGIHAWLVDCEYMLTIERTGPDTLHIRFYNERTDSRDCYTHTWHDADADLSTHVEFATHSFWSLLRDYDSREWQRVMYGTVAGRRPALSVAMLDTPTVPSADRALENLAGWDAAKRGEPRDATAGRYWLDGYTTYKRVNK